MTRRQLLPLLFILFPGPVLSGGEKVTILDSSGKTSHPTVECRVVKDEADPEGACRRYVVFLPEDHVSDVNLVIREPGRPVVFRGRLEKKGGIYRDKKVQAVHFRIRPDYASRAVVEFSEGGWDSLREYELSLVLPPS